MGLRQYPDQTDLNTGSSQEIAEEFLSTVDKLIAHEPTLDYEERYPRVQKH